MELSFNISSSEKLSKSCRVIGLNTFNSVCNHVKALPYGRNSERSDFTLVLTENKGTCSTKHAFLKQIAIENNKPTIMLCLGIYKMNNTNTKGVGEVLKQYNLNYIPEAHTYLKLNNTILDLTRTVDSEVTFKSSLLSEEMIMPRQIGDYKVNLHKNYLKRWIKEYNIPYTFKAIWDIREACIKALNQ